MKKLLSLFILIVTIIMLSGCDKPTTETYENSQCIIWFEYEKTTEVDGIEISGTAKQSLGVYGDVVEIIIDGNVLYASEYGTLDYYDGEVDTKDTFIFHNYTSYECNPIED